MMKSNKFLGLLVLAMMGATTLLLLHMKASQHRGAAGVKTRPFAGSTNPDVVEILMPESVPGWTSQIFTNIEEVLEKQLPKDTSFRVRGYTAADGQFVEITTVLMGSDRSSIHRPQICLTGQGWAVDEARSAVESIRMERPTPYDLPVNKLLATRQTPDGKGGTQTIRCLYVYWFVDEDRLTASANQWMLWWMPRDLLLHGKQERWAYISLFAPCLPGQEAATYERVKKLIASIVPEFQLVPKVGG